MMVGKVFGVASVFSVAALTFATAISGCSSDSTGSTDIADAKADRTPVTVDDSGSNLCYSDNALDASGLTYNSPHIQAGACTTANVAELVAYIKANAAASFADLETHVKATYSATCSSCIFSDVAAAAWAPIITDATRTGDPVVGVNGGGCIEIVSGKGNACGKAYHQWDRCIEQACNACTAEADYQSCAVAVQDTACAAASTALGTACGTNINAYIKTCQGTYGIDAWINYSCVAGSPFTDAGTDAGDGGDGGDGAAPPPPR